MQYHYSATEIVTLKPEAIERHRADCVRRAGYHVGHFSGLTPAENAQWERYYRREAKRVSEVLEAIARGEQWLPEDLYHDAYHA